MEFLRLFLRRHFAGKLVAWCRVSRDVGRFLWLVFYLCSFIFTAVSARKNFELELATGGSIALINIHIRQSYVDCSHTPLKKKKKQKQTIKKTKSIQSCVFLVVNVLVEEANTSN